MTRVGIYSDIQPEPSGSALGISLMLRLYFTVYPSSYHYTDTMSVTFKDNYLPFLNNKLQQNWRKLLHLKVYYPYPSPFSFYLLRFTFCLLSFNILLFTFYLLPLTFYILRFTFYLLPFTFYLLPFAFYLLPFTFYLLPFTFYLVLALALAHGTLYSFAF